MGGKTDWLGRMCQCRIIPGGVERKKDLLRNNCSFCDNPVTSIVGRVDAEKSEGKERQKEAQVTFQLSRTYRPILSSCRLVGGGGGLIEERKN